jgi:hypothetical protein
MEADWYGGKLGGTLKRQKAGWAVRFQSPYTQKTFDDADYGGLTESHAAAVAHRTALSEERGATKNKLRIAQDGKGPYLEVQLQGGAVMKCDLEDSPIVEGSVWTATVASRTGVVYSQRSANGTADRFHRLLHPEWKNIDHINRDGLDNRRHNLRDGVNKRNAARRADNRSGVTGVFYSSANKAWVASWRENGAPRRKYFYGTSELIKEEAVAFRHNVVQAQNAEGL